jgi:Flp pilus assembly CpaF family ATPase
LSEITLVDLVRNGTINAEIAATLWSIVAEKHSFMIVAVPRFAGKSTVGDAMLQFVSDDVPVHQLSGEESEMEQLQQHADGGYLVVGEFSNAPVPRYIWGSPVRKVFETMRAGYSLSTALHAPTVEEAYAAISQGNDVADEDASKISYMVYIERMGDDLDSFWRRVAEVHEVDRVVDGKPQGRLLHRWDAQADRFERVAEPRLLTVGSQKIAERASQIAELASSDQTGVAAIRTLVANSQR